MIVEFTSTMMSRVFDHDRYGYRGSRSRIKNPTCFFTTFLTLSSGIAPKIKDIEMAVILGQTYAETIGRIAIYE